MKLIRNIIKEHLDPHPKVGDYLYANTDMFTHIGKLKKIITTGNIYPILGVSVSQEELFIINNSRNVCTLPFHTVEKNFTVVPEEELPNIDDAFDNLYESVKGIPDELKLIFDPPISTPYNFENVMRVFNLKYPGIKWNAGQDCLGYNPFDSDILEDNTVNYIQIRHGKLSYISTDDADLSDEKGSKNGWKWLQKNDTDFDKTSKVFDSLYESEEDDLEWAEDLFKSMPEFPMVDGQRRIIRKGSTTTLTPEYFEYIFRTIVNNGYKFNDKKFQEYALLALNRGGYLHLHPKGNLSYGSSENVFTEANDLRYNDVPNIFI